MKQHSTRGFTLIELMITVAIIGILAAIAYPSYTEQIRKGKRAEARGLLLQAGAWMERFYTQNQRYDQNIATTVITDATLFPAAFSFAPAGAAAGEANYQFTVSATTANTYSITLAPLNSMVGDRCGTYIVTNTGAKGNTGATGFANAAEAARECWK